MIDNLVKYNILNSLPYGKAFHFVNDILSIDDNSITSVTEFNKNHFYYNSHFIDFPIIPGVIMIEAMGQAGMICHLIFLEKIHETKKKFIPVLSNLDVEFYKSPDYDKSYFVVAKKKYFRNKTLRSEIKLIDDNNEVYVLLSATVKIKYF